jgi:hypothetical protein
MEHIPWVGDPQVDHHHLGVEEEEEEVTDINRGLHPKNNPRHLGLYFTQLFLARMLAHGLNSKDLCLICDQGNLLPHIKKP